MENNLVSIITASYNTENFIKETIESVLSQTYQNWELIIIDDCSTDNSIAIIQNYLKIDSRIKLIKLEENSGAAITRNKGIQMASGTYIAFLDSDDLWMKDKLATQIAFMEKFNYNFTFTAYKKIDEKSELLPKCYAYVAEKVSYTNMVSSNKIGCLTAVYNQKNLGKMFMPIMRKRQDYGLWLAILKNEKYAYGINKPLALYRIRKFSVSSNKFELIKWNWILFYKIEKHSLIKAFYYLMLNIMVKIVK